MPLGGWMMRRLVATVLMGLVLHPVTVVVMGWGMRLEAGLVRDWAMCQVAAVLLDWVIRLAVVAPKGQAMRQEAAVLKGWATPQVAAEVTG